MSGFTFSNGKIYDPSGNAFVARGINVMGFDIGSSPSAATLQTDFPGINFVRLAIYNYNSPDSLAAYVGDLTSHGIVVELENHQNNAGGAGGSQGQIFTGSALATEQAWYASVAAAFKGNPNVWFGTNNEPSETDASGNNNPAALSDWQKTTYDTIRNAGNTSPVMLETTSWGPGGTNVNYKSADYSGMHNVVWDQHYYGWVSGYSTDQNTVTSTLNSIVSDTHAITSADGQMPVIIGEYGNSTTGVDIDANGSQVISAVLNSGMGNVAWAWGSGNPGDGLTTGGNGLSSYGQQVASGIAKQAASSASLPPVKTPTPTATGGSSTPTPPTTSGSSSSTPLKDSSGNTFALDASGQVLENGQALAGSGGTSAIALVGNTLYGQDAASKAWFTFNNGLWSSASAPPTATPSTNNTVVKAGSTSAIVDAAGNKWTITGSGQVAVNGTADATTANVNELAYVNGKIWQENASNLWWDKAVPTDAWGPAAGTATSPLPATTTPSPTVTPDTIKVSAAGVSSVVTAPKTVSGDTFSLTSTGVTNAVLGTTSTVVQFTGTAGVAVTGGSASALVLASAGKNSFTAGAGAMQVTGGSGADTYNFSDKSGFLGVQDFSAAKGDTLNIATSLKSSMQTVTVGSDTLLTFGGSGMIDLHGVTAAPTIHWTT